MRRSRASWQDAWRPSYSCHYSWFLLTVLRDPSQSTACELHHSFRFNSPTFQLELPVEDKHPFLLIMIPLSALESEPRVRLWLIGKNGYSGKWWIVTNRDMYGLRIKPTLSPGGHYLISSGNAQHADTLSVFCSGWLTPAVRWPQLGFLRPVSGRPTLWKTFYLFFTRVLFLALELSVRGNLACLDGFTSQGNIDKVEVKDW